MINTMKDLQNGHRNPAHLVNSFDKRALGEQAPGATRPALLTDTIYYLTHFPDAIQDPGDDIIAEAQCNCSPRPNVTYQPSSGETAS